MDIKEVLRNFTKKQVQDARARTKRQEERKTRYKEKESNTKRKIILTRHRPSNP